MFFCRTTFWQPHFGIKFLVKCFWKFIASENRVKQSKSHFHLKQCKRSDSECYQFFTKFICTEHLLLWSRITVKTICILALMKVNKTVHSRLQLRHWLRCVWRFLHFRQWNGVWRQRTRIPPLAGFCVEFRNRMTSLESVIFSVTYTGVRNDHTDIPSFETRLKRFLSSK